MTTKAELIKLLDGFEDDREIGFYIKGIGEMEVKDVQASTNLENGKPSILIEFKAYGEWDYDGK